MGILPSAKSMGDYLAYEPMTGALTWRVANSVVVKVGSAINYPAPGKRRYVGINKVQYLAHRLAWAIHFGEWPKGVIDHIDGDASNNKIANLRDVSVRVNTQNIRRARIDNKCGSLGVYQIKSSGKWRAQIKATSCAKHVGCFDTLEEAELAYVEAKRKHHEGCTI